MLLPLQLHGPQLIEIELFKVLDWILYGSILAYEKAVMAMKTMYTLMLRYREFPSLLRDQLYSVRGNGIFLVCKLQNNFVSELGGIQKFQSRVYEMSFTYFLTCWIVNQAII